MAFNRKAKTSLKKGGLKKGKSKPSSPRGRFHKRDSSVLEKTYNEKNERSKGGTSGKGIFNAELLKEHGVQEFKAAEGDNYFEILPLSFEANIPYFEEVPVHFSVGFNSDAFVCTDRYSSTPCFRCETQQHMFKENSKITDEIKKLYPTDRSVYLLWNRTNELTGDEDPEYKLQLWSAPKSKIHAEIQSKVRDKLKKTILDVSDISEGGEGRTVNFEYVPSKKKGTFADYKAVQLLERDCDIPDEIIEQLEALIDAANEAGFDNVVQMFLNIPEYDEVVEAMKSEKKPEDEEEEEESKGKVDKRGGKGKKKEKEEDSGDEEEEILEAIEALKEELNEMKSFQFKKWCKQNDYEDALEIDDREEAVEAIGDDIHEKFLSGDTDELPF
jgi:hypothetical protein